MKITFTIKWTLAYTLPVVQYPSVHHSRNCGISIPAMGLDYQIRSQTFLVACKTAERTYSCSGKSLTQSAMSFAAHNFEHNFTGCPYGHWNNCDWVHFQHEAGRQLIMFISAYLGDRFNTEQSVSLSKLERASPVLTASVVSERVNLSPSSSWYPSPSLSPSCPWGREAIDLHKQIYFEILWVPQCYNFLAK